MRKGFEDILKISFSLLESDLCVNVFVENKLERIKEN
jgi:hypothetical protein